ncbi:DUF4034 domain-containing protein, partial [Salmonella enterica subsp. enterica serovar Montevideo]|nr:DUF4034 domain-containing protein [Salmonella enterica subsp. enterica serovar Montevideo]
RNYISAEDLDSANLNVKAMQANVDVALATLKQAQWQLSQTEVIKNWQRARPRSTHAWLAEAQYWNHRAWLYRSYGWARETTRAM